MLRAACVTFPGSNCDQDMHRAIKMMGWELIPLWHNNALHEQVDIIFVPGGFSYGDYLRCGALARFSPAMKSILDHAKSGRPVMGVCNGFQILCEAGLLPGALVRNQGLRFRCEWTHLRVESDSLFTATTPVGTVLRIPIAHGEGNYVANADALKKLHDDNSIAFRYSDAAGHVSPEANPNGSTENIAGIVNKERNVLGMMPHPERAMEDILGGADGKNMFESIATSLAAAAL